MPGDAMKSSLKDYSWTLQKRSLALLRGNSLMSLKGLSALLFLHDISAVGTSTM
ncbi:hypothetical protein SLEP1_g47087 [Rubroshorea leprosula]|uniref:Uncharacterized protein n=1 Tax=Rubroshorea leprosula TaxID=152421 RepID=A0AAV5LQ38_9ROSI|nr:hypothetical protein SLEP1_g47087 [Rubroshorea leprosula]